MLVGTPLMEAEQDGSIRIEDLPKVVMGRKTSWLTEQRLVPSEAGRHVAHPDNRPRSLHSSLILASLPQPKTDRWLCSETFGPASTPRMENPAYSANRGSVASPGRS